GSPLAGPWLTSSSSALSRTERDTTCPTAIPPQPSPVSGPSGVRALVGLSPTRPQHEAGILIEPPPSVAWAAGTIPAATAAAAPPLEPPEVRDKSHGLRQGPSNTDSVVAASPTSGVLDLPRITRPALRYRVTISASWSGTNWSHRRLPRLHRTPFTKFRSLMRKGTPASLPETPFRALARASS